MAKNAIVLVSYGTTDEEAHQKTIGNIIVDLKASFPDYEVFEAYTSQLMRDRMSKQGKPMCSLSELLEGLKQKHYAHVLVVSALVTAGITYDTEICSAVRAFSSDFAALDVTDPLLSTREDCAKILAALLMDLHVPPDVQLVLAGHGIPHQKNDSMIMLQEHVDREGLPVHVGGIADGTSPGITEVLNRLKKTAGKRILLVPFFLAAGKHVKEDLAGEGEDSWKHLFEREGYEVSVNLHSLGEYPMIRQIFLQKAKAAKSKI
jgi:sirohydrochlorin cobaltochelatase